MKHFSAQSFDHALDAACRNYCTDFVTEFRNTGGAHEFEMTRKKGGYLHTMRGPGEMPEMSRKAAIFLRNITQANFVQWCQNKHDFLCDLVAVLIVKHVDISQELGMDIWTEMIVVLIQYEVHVLFEEMRTWGRIDIDLHYDSNIHMYFKSLSNVGVGHACDDCGFKSFSEFYKMLSTAMEIYSIMIQASIKEGLFVSLDGSINSLEFMFKRVLHHGTTVLMTMTNNRDFDWCFEKNMALYVRLTATVRSFLQFERQHVGILSTRAKDMPELLIGKLKMDVKRFMGLDVFCGLEGLSLDLMHKNFQMIRYGENMRMLSNLEVSNVKLAVAMGRHPRLGKKCLLVDMDSDLFEYIVREVCMKNEI